MDKLTHHRIFYHAPGFGLYYLVCIVRAEKLSLPLSLLHPLLAYPKIIAVAPIVWFKELLFGGV